MNWEQIEGQWTQVKGSVKKAWGKLTDDDLEQLSGEREELIGKIQKANLYAREPDRVTFSELTTTFRGENDTHTVGFRDDHWRCDCDFFSSNAICSHVMAIQKLLGSMLPADTQATPAPARRGTGGHGLPSMRARAALLGGTLTIRPAPGGGTVLRLVCPIANAAA